jgi:CRAL/TRIO domain
VYHLQLHRHYIYITEFIWNKLDTGDESKLLTIMDLRGVSVTQFAGEVREFMVRAAKLIGAHYPERSLKIFVLNAPWWFNMVWKVCVCVIT